MARKTTEPAAGDGAPASTQIEQNDLFLSKKERRRQHETPLMRQYWKIKDRHPGALLLFRMGDFYETFEHDAKVVADVLGITLTKRSNGKADDVPLAGFPHHALEQHLPKLVAAGHRVAVCEQLEDPKHARKIVKRGVVEVVTPGVAFRDQLLAPKHAHYLAAVAFGNKEGDPAGFAFCDATTGEFFVTEVDAAHLPELVQTVAPAELLFDKRRKDRLGALRSPHLPPFAATPQEDWVFGRDFAYETLLRHFKTHSLKGYGVDDLQAGLVAAGAVLYYLSETQKGRLPHLRRIQRYAADEHIALDPQTKRNLELVASLQDGRRDGTLVGVLDATLTPMGARMLRAWLVRPLRDRAKIEQRLAAVADLHGAPRLRARLRTELGHVGDLERLVGKVCTGRANPRDLAQLRQTLRQIPALKEAIQEAQSETLQKVAAGLTLCQGVVDRVGAALAEEPPAQLGQGGVIRAGFSDELDELRGLSASGKTFLTELQARESQRTGIPSLKVSYNRVFGYYLEVTNTHKDKVPPEWTRKQTLVNAERYVTDELKRYEEKILTAEERIGELEKQLFEELRMAVADEAEPMQRNARFLALLDTFAALAEVAEKNGYCRPEIADDGPLELVECRHPVVERALPPGEAFIPNTVRLDAEGGEAGQIHLITGPNMAGKSVVLRQTALAVLLAQVGSFVPCERARVPVVDKIFTRVGASDNLAAGESTFLVEMNETANILNNATPKSLVLLDEVGRGTSTFDGLSIAWAVVEHLHEHAPVRAMTLFATHYHELNALAERLPRVHSFAVQVQEHAGRVVFLRRLVPGSADHSYGIEVAEMAGLPDAVVQRAKQVLAHLEAHDVAAEVGVHGDALPATARPQTDVPEPRAAPPPPAAHPRAGRLLASVEALDVDRLTPIEALLKLAELKRLAQ